MAMSSTPSWVTDPQITTIQSPGEYDGGTSNAPNWLTDDAGGTVATSRSNTTTTPTSTVQIDTAVAPLDTSTTIAGAGTGAGEEEPQSHAQQARQKTWGQFWSSSFRRDGRTLLITILILVCMNIPVVKWGLYPFTIFSTWIHELCHGVAALMLGGSIRKLEIFTDGSGLASTTLPGSQVDRRAFVTSAGYQGTAVIGMLLLMIRRTKRGPRLGTVAIAFMMILSVAIWVRNVFGIAFILGMGFLLAAAACYLSSFWIRNLYVVLSVTCALNAITSVRALFNATAEVNGNEVSSDAESMAEIQGGTRTMWALIWLFLALGLALLGLVFAIPGPNQSADFTLCGMCQDCGCFYIFNAEGKRLCSRLFGRAKPDDDNNDVKPGDANGANNV